MKNKKRIIISSYDDLKNPFYGGGGAYVVHEIAKRLTSEFDITVVTGKYPGCKNEIIDRVEYERIGIAEAGPKLGQLIYYFMLFFYFKVSKFDLWIENFTPPFSTNFLQLFTKKPVIGLVYMLVGEDMKRKYKIPFDIIEKIGIKTYKYFITPTEYAKKTISLLNPQANVKLISHGINLTNTKNIESKLKNDILYMGRIEMNQKGLDLLLNAFNYIQDKTNQNLLVAGSGTPGDLSKLKEMIKKLGLENKVKLQGRVNGKIKDELFLNSLFIVIPSRFETFSITALESLSFGLPVVAFEIDGLGWMPEGSILKIKKFDPKALGEAMLRLVSDSGLRTKMSEIGMKYAKANTWDRISNKYEQYIESLL